MFLGLRVRFHSCMVVHCAEDGRRVRHRSIFPSLVLLVSDGLYIYHTPALTSYLSFFFFFPVRFAWFLDVPRLAFLLHLPLLLFLDGMALDSGYLLRTYLLFIIAMNKLY